MFGTRGSGVLRFYYYWIALFVFVIDYVTKKVIENKLELHEIIPVIGDFFVITSIRNRGAAFGILQEQRFFFIAITLVVVSAIVWYIHRNRNGRPLLLVGLGLVLGGAVGNFLDRALYGEVVDFLQFTFGSYVFPIFNIADTGICVGVGLILLDSFLSMKNENQETSDTREHDGQQPIQ
ncbi:signal peptidase II [Paenibacillus xanthanilyticus]|uniref:Lipoprotein signal peptidase n=1 Tax=Paenibacillus xanthanilyticus TaxID=1783531 RepID=A0ABV8KCW5_9BACL